MVPKHHNAARESWSEESDDYTTTGPLRTLRASKPILRFSRDGNAENSQPIDHPTKEELDGIPPTDQEHTRTCNQVADVYT